MTGRWDEWAFELRPWVTPAVTGIWAFYWYPTAKDGQGRPIRIGGNWPILVDQDTGACRIVRGAKEMAALRGTWGARTAGRRG
ncbi:hypothetical protein [Streptomyces liangshanensis]|uniref:hypothetical protein n=1 Tax=Streptomyces liangshanensis TaxID=2717324 RepID=UPI0036DEF9BE